MEMGFCTIRKSVVWMLLLFALSNVRGQPVAQFSSLDADCPVELFESQLVNMKDQLNRLQKIVSTLNKPLINAVNCIVDLAAFGFNDSTKYGYIRTSQGSSEEIYVPGRVDRYRGVTLVELDAATCTTRNRQHFDTYWLTSDTFYKEQFLEALESAIAGTIVVGVSADSAEHGTAFQTIARSFFNRYNMDLTGLETRDKFVFVMQKGYPRKTQFRRKPRGGESLRVKVAIRGLTVQDVTFREV